MPESNNNDMEQRLTLLEQRLQRSQILLGAATVLAVASAVVAMLTASNRDTRPEVLTARELQITDEKGQVHVRAFSQDGGGRLEVNHGDTGVFHAWGFNGHGTLSLRSKEGDGHMLVTVMHDTPTLQMFGTKQDVPLVILTTSGGKRGEIGLLDNASKTAYATMIGKRGELLWRRQQGDKPAERRNVWHVPFEIPRLPTGSGDGESEPDIKTKPDPKSSPRPKPDALPDKDATP